MNDDLSDQPLADDLSFADLQDRSIYEVYSRNLLRGAYRAADRVIIGIREKFGTTSLFAEAINDPPGRGTVSRILAKLGSVPEGVELEEGRVRSGRYSDTRDLMTILAGYDAYQPPCSVCGALLLRNGYCSTCYKQRGEGA